MFISSLVMLLAGPAWAGDKDKDGIKKGDQCPTEAEDKDGFEDEDGCPDPDNDKDGVEDGDDKCPDEAEDKDGFQDEDGCPDPDNDNDGVPDVDDKCMDEIENDDTKDGCPNVTYDFLNTDGWVPAITTLNDALVGALGKQAEGCPEASRAAKMWLDRNDADKLHRVFKARVARGGEEANASSVISVLNAQATFWDSAKGAFDIFCKDDATWTEVSPKLDVVYKKAAEKAE